MKIARKKHPKFVESSIKRKDSDEDMMAHGGEVEHVDPVSRPDYGFGAIIVKKEDDEKKMAHGGSIEREMDMQPEEAIEEHAASVAASIMAKRRKMADGGILSHDSIYSDRSNQVDLSRNADEDANEEDQLSFNALRKENYSESEGLSQLTQPRDSNLIGDEREDQESDKHDRIGAIRKRMKSRI